MKAIFVLLLSGTFCSVLAQKNDTTGRKPEHRIQVGIGVAVNMTGAFSNGGTKPFPGFDAALNVKRNYTQQIALQSGIQYSMMNSTTSGYSSVNRYNCLSIPFKLVITPGNDEVRFTCGVGISGDLLIHAAPSMLWYSAEKTHMVSLNTSVHFQIGLDYKLSKKRSLQVMPTFHMQLISTKNDGLYRDERPFAAGVCAYLYFGK